MSTLNPTSRGNGGVKKSQLKKLSDNYYQIMKKKDENGNIVDLDPTKDAKSVWFTKAAIDKMFADHGCHAGNNNEFGLRVYFAVHKTGVLHPDHEIPGHYHNQQTVILVPTKNINGQKDKDLLKDDEQLTQGADGKGDGIPDGEGQGVNHGALCPPDTDCGCSI
ncbi:hypothetical protein [Mucilaginibacter boryungensis]|uniref:Uncharacterized protein n=1 Tax=Mucilaginibacter boryungensis TaxID=768480 RepID=A0ABR9XMG4_9SPHI|nr:hypothetical protein [Mucilaginibacter boryungensis]MBE9668571.1 hypothetical protein [Mucilaginibacter boryungensis]